MPFFGIENKMHTKCLWNTKYFPQPLTSVLGILYAPTSLDI